MFVLRAKDPGRFNEQVGDCDSRKSVLTVVAPGGGVHRVRSVTARA